MHESAKDCAEEGGVKQKRDMGEARNGQSSRSFEKLLPPSVLAMLCCQYVGNGRQNFVMATKIIAGM